MEAELSHVEAKLSSTVVNEDHFEQKILSEVNSYPETLRIERKNLHINNSTQDKENCWIPQLDKTPEKQAILVEPGTPTANLKMLVSAASVLLPAPSCRKGLSALNGHSPDTKITEKQVNKTVLTGRKEKSLGLLCEKFMAVYPEYSESGTTIMLDDVVKILSIGRRRVYDIVNVLESMEMMVRQAKNKYLWFGKSRLQTTLTKLKALAVRVYGEGFCHILKRYHHVNIRSICEARNQLGKRESDEETLQIKDVDRHQSSSTLKNILAEDDPTNSIMDKIINYDLQCSQSLGILCQKFIMLFMVSENNVVTLDRAAKLLITEPGEGPCKYKTKVRRLYDIANILTSMKFLTKCTSYEDPTKKAAYKWIGFDLKTLNCIESTKRAFAEQELTLTRHSLLVQVPRKNEEDKRKFQCRSLSAHQLSSAHAEKAALPRTCSATNLDPAQDGFDVSHLDEADSPNQALFKEKLRDLHIEFPDKLPSNGLLALLSACQEQPEKRSRRSLSSAFNDDSPPSKKIKEDDIKQLTADVCPRQVAMCKRDIQQKPQINSMYANVSHHPVLLSPTQISVNNSGYYQLVPVQYGQNGVASHMIGLPMVLHPKQTNNGKTLTPPTTKPLLKCVSKQNNKKDTQRVRTTSRPVRVVVTPNEDDVNSTGKYPEYCTPPHVLPKNCKPLANPIIFPKMTPETPSSECQVTIWNTVTRKLMSATDNVS